MQSFLGKTEKFVCFILRILGINPKDVYSACAVRPVSNFFPSRTLHFPNNSITDCIYKKKRLVRTTSLHLASLSLLSPRWNISSPKTIEISRNSKKSRVCSRISMEQSQAGAPNAAQMHMQQQIQRQFIIQFFCVSWGIQIFENLEVTILQRYLSLSSIMHHFTVTPILGQKQARTRLHNFRFEPGPGWLSARQARVRSPRRPNFLLFL